MEDKAKKLYEMYATNMSKLGIGVDEWEDLDDEDQQAWGMTAQDIMSDGL